MRPYNRVTDFPILYKAAQANNNMNLSIAKAVLNSHNIAWPINFNNDTSASAMELDHDLCTLMNMWKVQG
jgi:hypothetical protein